MRFNDAGLALLKQFEGCKLTAYQDCVGIWTIGYGSTDHVVEGMTITQDEADERLREYLDHLCPRILSVLDIPISENQFSALVVFAYNVGTTALITSTLLKKLNAADFVGAAYEFLKWDKAGGNVVEGLKRRRIAEHQLFITA